MPNLGRSWGESSLQPFGCKLVRLQLGQIQVASTAIHLHLLHGHRPRSRPDQNPKSKIQTPNGPFGVWILDFGFWILDFGFRILDFGFWISDFGFWILYQFSLRSFCGGPKRPRLDFGFRILDFGFRILDFGLLPIVWVLHKIFPSHADSGRRIFLFVQQDQISMGSVLGFLTKIGMVWGNQKTVNVLNSLFICIQGTLLTFTIHSYTV